MFDIDSDIEIVKACTVEAWSQDTSICLKSDQWKAVNPQEPLL